MTHASMLAWEHHLFADAQPASLVAMLGVPEALIIALVIAGCVAMRRGCCRAPRSMFSLIAIAAIVGGLFVFGSRAEHKRTVLSGPAALRVVSHDDRGHSWGDSLRHQIERDVREGLVELDELSELHQLPHLRQLSAPSTTSVRFSRVGLIALGALLIICGWLLFNRDRTRPVAVKGITALGLAATAWILVSFVGSWNGDVSSRHGKASRDRVVRNTTDRHDEGVLHATPVTDDGSRPISDERPLKRAKRPAPRTEVELPQRAGTIPVDEESAAEAQPAAPVENDSEPAPDNVAPPEPAAEVEVEAAEAAPKASDPREDAPRMASAAPRVAAAPAPRTASSVEVAVEAPDWLNTPGKLVNSVYRASIESGLYADVPECQRALDETMKAYADDYVDRLMGEGAAALVNIDRAYLNEHVKRAEYSEVVMTESVGPMHRIHALLEFDDGVRAEFHQRWRHAVVTQRVWYVGSAAVVVLALLSTLYGYLKLDQETRGTQTGKLQVAATLVALIVAVGALLARWAVPF